MCSIFPIILFIVHRSYQLAFILGCFWLIGTTFDCHKLPHKNDFHKREKIIKGGTPNALVYTCCPRYTKQKIQQTSQGVNKAFNINTH